MKNSHVLLLMFGLLAWAPAVQAQSTAEVLRNSEALEPRSLILERGAVQMLVPFTDQASTSAEEDGSPTGPDIAIRTYLVDKFSAMSDAIDDDFDRSIPYSDELIRDHTSLNTYYFYPAGYLLKRDSMDGYALDFLHLDRSEGESSDLILMTFTLSPRQLDGGLPLLETLAEYAIKPANDKPLHLSRLVIQDININLGALSAVVPEENIQVVNSPNRVGGDIQVQARMNQVQKEQLVAAIRGQGLSGDITFVTNEGRFELTIPYFVRFTDYSGEWISNIKQMATDAHVVGKR